MPDLVGVNIESKTSDFGFLVFKTGKMNLQVGEYRGADGGFDAFPGAPAFELRVNAYNCLQSAGRFMILQADFTRTGDHFTLTSFAAEFETRCRTDNFPVQGHLYYNYVPRTPRHR
jgi:hypothetical protein